MDFIILIAIACGEAFINYRVSDYKGFKYFLIGIY